VILPLCSEYKAAISTASAQISGCSPCAVSIGVVTGPPIGFQKDPLLLVARVSARRPGALHLAQGRRARFCYLSRL
jgi:hypothetical protein